MKVLVLGSGGREHALAWKLAASSRVERVFVGPGSAGTTAVATNLPDVNPLSFDTVEAACRTNDIDCVFVGPETPLAAGVVDFLASQGVPALGPGKEAARLESSKAFSKSFLVRNGLPTAAAEEFSDAAAFERFVRGHPGQRLVVKKSGLAAGKGVLESLDQEELIAFGRAILRDDALLVEEFLEGWEVSIFGLCDSRDFVVLPPCTDFKKAHDGDIGPNTGGMGSICPVPWVTDDLMRTIHEQVVQPTYSALAREGLAYAGVLYFGLMITARGPMILEFNVRFGDPETQVLLPVLGADLGSLFEAMTSGTLARWGAAFPSAGLVPSARSVPSAQFVPASQTALGVVVASRGYPESSEKGELVALPHGLPPGSLIFHASTMCDRVGQVLTGGGRCFTAVGSGRDLAEAGDRAYAAAASVSFDGAWYRRDIGRKFMT